MQMQEQEPPTLRRELRFWEAIALSIAVMAPTAAMALNGTLPATLIGRAVPLAFIFATVGVIFVAYAFVRLTSYFSHAGSVYAFSGVTLGPRAGFFAGWALLGTYIAFVAASTAEVGLFGVAFFQSTGIWDGAEWLLIALVAGVGMTVFAYGDIRAVTRSLLGLEGLSVTLIVILVIVIFVKLATGDAPRGQGFTADIFKVPSGTSLDTVATAAVFGFLSFGGFDGAAALGEETDDPTRNIPRAIAAAVLVSGGFYILVIIAQTLGFGTDAAGVKAFGGSSAPLGDLSRSYVGRGLADAIDLGATISAFAAALAAATAASRILFALGRDGFGFARLGQASSRTGAPAGALAVVMMAALAVTIVQRIVGTSAVNAFLYPGTIGVLAMLVAYIVTNVGAIRFLFVAARRAPLWQIVVPIIGIAFLGYTIWKNIDGTSFPYNRFPIVVGVWLIVGLSITVAFPALTRRIGESLAREVKD
ncbi:APC family permease [Candidatus Solirubrobacter pratensis]|uniref:APC family permease n=1 Tax=Candidatus Solirubrobacter pratensis TaxID=1298857 RepID=UPI000420A58A|nr:APC family permease [Candidatus Solirubrobacter pratensis]